jgi:hypothetical protein
MADSSAAGPSGRYLDGLRTSLLAVEAQGEGIRTEDFAQLCGHILGALDHLGPVRLARTATVPCAAHHCAL